MRSITTTFILSACVLSLAACASVPSQNDLIAGIDQSKLTQGASKTLSTTDPTCVDFYKNVAEFHKKAQSGSSTKNFFTSLGVNVASAVVASQVVPSDITSQTGRVAAYAAAGSVTSQGSRIAIRELNSSDRADAKIIEVAQELGCPVAIKP